MGPIGVDNSELINIEIEEEYKEKNQYIQNLVSGKQKKGTNDKSQMSTNNASEQNKENITNDRLMQRLTKAANSNQNNHHNPDQSKMTSVMQSKSKLGNDTSIAFSHEEWLRRKEHEVKLKEQLIREAKRD